MKDTDIADSSLLSRRHNDDGRQRRIAIIQAVLGLITPEITG
ncbi:hypothetical protein AXX16_2224 [Serratia rubidaea]|nr:hypothetical protein AXX16_2224 [Serratia rubidaea]